LKKSGRILRILVVDDEPLILWGISKFLAEISEVKTVATAEQALDEIKRQDYDLCFLDYNLPGMKGLEAMKIMNVQTPNTKVAIMSGSFMDEALKRQIDAIAFAFIEKPFDLSKIREVAERVANARD